MEISPEYLKIGVFAIALLLLYTMVKKVISLILPVVFLAIGGFWYMGYEQVKSDNYGETFIDEKSVGVYHLIDNSLSKLQNEFQ